MLLVLQFPSIMTASSLVVDGKLKPEFQSIADAMFAGREFNLLLYCCHVPAEALNALSPKELKSAIQRAFPRPDPAPPHVDRRQA